MGGNSIPNVCRIIAIDQIYYYHLYQEVLLFLLASACCCATNVVEDAGHPTPGPLRFCSVISDASMRAEAEVLSVPVGNVTATVGL